MGRFYHESDGFLMLCVLNLCVEPILISKPNFDRICDDVGITFSWAPFDDLPHINAK